MIKIKDSKRHESQFEIENTEIFYSAPIVELNGNKRKVGY
jgi:hypothetical protein